MATEFEILLPGSNDEPGVGASWLGIVSQDGPGDRSTSTLGTALTREHRAGLFVGITVEGPYDWKVRTAAGVVDEREFNSTEIFSTLGGAIWRVSDNLSFDFIEEFGSGRAFKLSERSKRTR